MKSLVLVFAGFAAFLAAPAHAQLRADWDVNKAAKGEWDGGYTQKAERRSGFAASIGLGAGIAAARGYPNEIGRIDDPEYRSSTGPGFGTVNTIWLGGALRDWFVFGLGIWGMGANANDLEAVSGGFMLRVETFPLWSLGGRLRDLSLFTNLGFGGMTIEGGPEKAEDGLMSMISFGSSFELFRLKYFAVGPSLEGVYLYSRAGLAGGGFLGVKGTVYGGP